MTYWRMQLHPNDAAHAVRHTVTSLAANLIGLDFGSGSGPTYATDDVGDLLRVNPTTLPENQGVFRAFATEMIKGDLVLVVVHKFPFALCRVAGEYNYVREVPPELKAWFRHFRRVDDVRYYGDFVKNAHDWEEILMVNTIAAVRDPESAPYKLIQRWLGAAQQ
jgi:hypothetical protein